MQKQNMLDCVILVDEFDHPIGTMDKYEAHRHGASLHRAISVYIFRNSGSKAQPKWELLLQQRSLEKIVGGGMWANTVCGNVRPGESYRECAYRRLKQELGLRLVQIESANLEEVYKFHYFAQCNEEYSEREMDQIFVGVVDGDIPVVLNSDEVMDICWVNFDNLMARAGNEQEMAEVVEESAGKAIKKSVAKIAPWFALMMQHAEIQKTIKDYLEKNRK